MAAFAVVAFFGIAGGPHQALVKVRFRHVFQLGMGGQRTGLKTGSVVICQAFRISYQPGFHAHGHEVGVRGGGAGGLRDQWGAASCEMLPRVAGEAGIRMEVANVVLAIHEQ